MDWRLDWVGRNGGWDFFCDMESVEEEGGVVVFVKYDEFWLKRRPWRFRQRGDGGRGRGNGCRRDSSDNSRSSSGNSKRSSWMISTSNRGGKWRWGGDRKRADYKGWDSQEQDFSSPMMQSLRCEISYLRSETSKRKLGSLGVLRDSHDFSDLIMWAFKWEISDFREEMREREDLIHSGQIKGNLSATCAGTFTHSLCSQQEHCSHCNIRPDSSVEAHTHLTISSGGPGLTSTSAQSKRSKWNKDLLWEMYDREKKT